MKASPVSNGMGHNKCPFFQNTGSFGLEKARQAAAVRFLSFQLFDREAGILLWGTRRTFRGRGSYRTLWRSHRTRNARWETVAIGISRAANGRHVHQHSQE